MKLGRFELNNVYLEDSYKAIKELPDKCVDLIYTDIPYLIETSSNKGKKKSAVCQRISNLFTNDLNEIINGIDYSILDEFVRISRYIYIYGVVRNKFCRLWNTLLRNTNVHLIYLCGAKRILHQRQMEVGCQTLNTV